MWDVLACPQKIAGRPDACREVVALRCDADAPHRALVEAAASRTLELRGDARGAWKPVKARNVFSVRHDPVIMKMLRDLTTLIGGLPGSATRWAMQVCEADPSVISSQPRSARFMSGGPLPVHQDYEPRLNYEKERSLNFYMLMQDTTHNNGATFIFPGSRALTVAAPDTTMPKKRGRPAKKIAKKKSAGAPLHSHAMFASLQKHCGEPVVFAGKKYTIFRHESSDWHGAFPNNSGAERNLLAWSYITKGLVGAISLEA